MDPGFEATVEGWPKAHDQFLGGGGRGRLLGGGRLLGAAVPPFDPGRVDFALSAMDGACGGVGPDAGWFLSASGV